jgi:hypothetical protein
MATLTLEIPEMLLTELNQRRMPAGAVDSFVARALALWLQTDARRVERSNGMPSLFTESAEPFIEALLDDHFELFERLAKL